MTAAVLPLLLFAAALPKASMIPVSEVLEPNAALASFELADGLQIELVASEPMVVSPVAMAFDEHDRLFVVEMPGYPLGNPPGEKPADRIALLEDTNGDGRMDKRTIYADGLAFPTGVLPWKDGIIVTCAPDILLLRDTDGDGRANERRVLFTGFSITRNVELRINCPTLGPEGWIYIASGLSGGTITTPDHPERPALKMTADVRFQPDTLELENVDGRSQYGMSFDAAGRRFICMNRLPVQHVVLASKWLQRNPNLTFTETVEDCNERTMRNLYRAAEQPSGVQLFPISSHFVNVDSHAGSFTAACGVHIWRGSGLPQIYRGAAFSCDPTANLVHVDRLLPHGATFAAEPILDGHEFLASHDDWFRPVFLTTGPDDALYVADMYQKIIEHVDFLPEEVRKYADVNAGRDRGRIWRVVVKEKPAVPVQPEPIVAKEAWIDVPQPEAPAAANQWLQERLDAAASPDARTRFLAALVLGDVSGPRATAALAAIAVRDMSDRWARAAVLGGVAGREVEVFKALAPHLRDSGRDEQEFLTVLGRGFPDLSAVRSVFLDETVGGKGLEKEQRFGIAAALLLGLSEKTGRRLGSEPDDPWLDAIRRESIRRAQDADYPLAQRITRVRLLGRISWEQAGATLQHLAVHEPNESLRSAAIRSLAGFDEPEVVRTLLAAENWSAATPTQRTTSLSALLPSAFHLGGLLGAIESGAVPASAISGVPRRQLLARRQ
jgi:putative membrane-bound dehydrogenase-like protein